jgi:hypothetical protein
MENVHLQSMRGDGRCIQSVNRRRICHGLSETFFTCCFSSLLAFEYLFSFLLFGCESTDLIKITDAHCFNDKSFQDVQYLTSNIVNDTFIGSVGFPKSSD